MKLALFFLTAIEGTVMEYMCQNTVYVTSLLCKFCAVPALHLFHTKTVKRWNVLLAELNTSKGLMSFLEINDKVL